jgi:hypothetical protein
VVSTHNGILFSHKIERNTAICDKMDETGWCYAKWNKPDTGWQILYDLSYIEILLKVLNSNGE